MFLCFFFFVNPNFELFQAINCTRTINYFNRLCPERFNRKLNYSEFIVLVNVYVFSGSRRTMIIRTIKTSNHSIPTVDKTTSTPNFGSCFKNILHAREFLKHKINFRVYNMEKNTNYKFIFIFV